MDDLSGLPELVHSRNMLEQEITELIGRPAAVGHIGEFIFGALQSLRDAQACISNENRPL